MDDKHGEPTTDALAHAAQALAITISVVEAIARLRAQRAQEAADERARAVAAARVDQALRHDTARLLWTPAFDDHLLRRMSAGELLEAWSAAVAYRDHDPAARSAADRIEERLRQLHPEAMTAYERALADGQPRTAAMQGAVGLFRGEYGLDPVGTPSDAADAASRDQQTRSADGAADVRAAPDADVHAQRRATVHVSDVTRARALAGVSQPVPIDAAMVSAPRAAKALLALPPPPVRRQLPAAPHSAVPTARP